MLYWLAGQLNFNRITVRGVLPPAQSGPVLYLGLHRNGAADGIPYLHTVPGAAYLVSAQLHRSALGRFVFPGIAVARPKDIRRGISADNEGGLARCIEHLVAGGALFIMPEGTSTLGPRHLHFKPGAAKIAHEVLQRGGRLSVVPLALHYECAWEWQSRIEVVIDAPVPLPAGSSVIELQACFTRILEQMGINVETLEALRLIEMLAYAATLGTELAYADCLKRFEQGIPDELCQQAEQLGALAERSGALKHQGVPLVPTGSPLPYFIAWLLLAPLVLAGLLANLPPILAGHIASRKLPDDLNVVAFWRILVGFPALLLWLAVIVPALWISGGPRLALAYIGISVAGLKLYYRVRKLSIALFNSVRAPALRPALLALRETLLRSVRDA